MTRKYKLKPFVSKHILIKIILNFTAHFKKLKRSLLTFGQVKIPGFCDLVEEIYLYSLFSLVTVFLKMKIKSYQIIKLFFKLNK